MINFTSSRKMLWIFVAIGALAILAMAVAVAISPRTSAPVNQNGADQANKPTVQVNKVDNSKLPDNFPSEIPLEAGAEVTQNYTAATADGRAQSTRTFATAKTLDQNFQLYQSFFQKNGWKIISTINQPQFKAILVSNGDLDVQVNISENPTTKIRTVDITVTKSASK